MVKLDVSLLRFMEDEDFRVLTALEMAMRNHDVAPTALVENIAQLPHGGCRKRLQNLLKNKMIHHENTMYDGYAMKYGAYDYLALRTFSKRGTCTGVGHRIGCGKESDIVLVHDEAGNECVLKLQRLGRCSFRSVMRNRDYKGNGRTRHGESWFYLSRLASQKEFSFMKALYEEGFPVPQPIDQNRHALLMELIQGTLLNNVLHLDDADKVYRRCLDLMVKLAESGLIHGDFNEFNLLITNDQRVMMIDFPQMVSINHPNAAELFDRDVHNLATFFQRRFKVETQYFPTLEKDVMRKGDLDKRVFASGYFTKKNQADLERMMEEAFSQSKEENEAENSEGGVFTHTGELSTSEEENVENELDHATNAIVAIPAGEMKDGENSDDLTTAQPEIGGDSDTERDSLGEAVEDARQLRLLNARKSAGCNENFLPEGEINQLHVKQQIRKTIRRQGNHEFNCQLHRNAQKGREKQKICRKIKNARSHEFFD